MMAAFRILILSLLGISLWGTVCIDCSNSENTTKLELSASKKSLPPLGRQMRGEFFMDENFIQLNHGSYGTYPKHVRNALRAFQALAEKNVDTWMRRDAKVELGKVRKALGKYLNADEEDLVIIPNTTGGMNAIFQSLVFKKGEQILRFNTVYSGMQALIQYIVDTSHGNASSLVFDVTYPITNEKLMEDFAFFLDNNHSKESPIKIALIDHISSAPAVINPVEKMIPLLKAKNIWVLIDGAHAIGQIPVDIKALDPDFYITDAHKWLYAARGAATMYVKKEHQAWIHPAHISSNYQIPSNFQDEFFWTGTIDYSPYLTIPAAIEFRKEIGEENIYNYNHNLAVEGGALAARILGTRVLQTEDQIGSMVDVELPIINPEDSSLTTQFWLANLVDQFNVYAIPYKRNGKIWIRFSAQIYADLSDFVKVAQVFAIVCNEINQEKS